MKTIILISYTVLGGCRKNLQLKYPVETDDIELFRDELKQEFKTDKILFTYEEEC